MNKRTRQTSFLRSEPTPPRKKLSRRERRKHNDAVEDWARDKLLREVLPGHPDTTEQDLISVDGSGPPANWRSHVHELIAAEATKRGIIVANKPSNLTLLKLGIRFGWAPRSVMETIPQHEEHQHD